MSLFSNRELFVRYLKAICIPLPVYFIIVILITGTPEFGKALGMNEIPQAGLAIMITYITISISDIGCSLLSQCLKSRKIPLYLYLTIMLAGIILFLFFPAKSLFGFYLRCVILGTGMGFWAVPITALPSSLAPT